MLKLFIVQGCDESWNLQANTNTAPASGDLALLITDTYTAKLWLGGSTPLLVAPTIVWLTVATVNMAISKVQSATLNRGVTYPVEIYRDRGAIHNCIGLFTMTCL